MIVPLKRRDCLGSFCTGFFISLRWIHGLNKRGAGDEREARVGDDGNECRGDGGRLPYRNIPLSGSKENVRLRCLN